MYVCVYVYIYIYIYTYIKYTYITDWIYAYNRNAAKMKVIFKRNHVYAHLGSQFFFVAPVLLKASVRPYYTKVKEIFGKSKGNIWYRNN